mgnify:CR=1 FL=1
MDLIMNGDDRKIVVWCYILIVNLGSGFEAPSGLSRCYALSRFAISFLGTIWTLNLEGHWDLSYTYKGSEVMW